MQEAKLKIKKAVWTELIKELRKRGKGVQESGAFLLGRIGTNEILQFKCYDDLDPDCLGGIITFKGSAYSLLWNYCTDNQLTVLADVHTHPGSWTGQSGSDQQHPMISQIGHIAIIVPNYAQKRRTSLKGVGFYKYLGEKKWEIFKTTKKALQITII